MANTSKNKNDRPATLPDGLALPQEQEIEKAILSGLMASHRHMPTLAAQLLPEMFTLPQVAMAFEAYLNIYNRGESADALSVEKELRRIAPDKETLATDLYQLALGGRYLETSDEYMPTHARHLREAYVARQFMLSCYDSALKASRPDRDTEALLKEMDSHVGRLMERLSHATNSVVMKEATLLAKERMLEIQRRVTEGRTPGIHTGLEGLDRMTGGMMQGTLNVIAARPRVGKTAFALNVAMRAALSGGATVAIFSLEMSKESLMDRMLCAWGRVELSRVRRGFLEDDDWAKLSASADALSRAKIFIDDTAGLTPLALRARCRRLKAEHGLDLVMVDYLQLMHSARNDSRELEISDISRNLKALAKELKVPVIALSQLNRKVEERTDKRPVLSDLRESGAIEQDADLIMFIHREDAYNKKGDRPKTGIAEIIIGKHRNGPTGTVELAYRPEFTAFDDLETTYVEPSESQQG